MADQSVYEGIKLELVPLKSTYPAGKLPEFKAVISNISQSEKTICTYMIKHRLLCSLFGNNYWVFPFGTTPTPLLTNEDFKKLKPGEKITYQLSVAEEPNYHFVFAGHQPKVVTEDLAVEGFPAGTYTFQVHIGPQVTFSVAEDKTYQHKNMAMDILNELVKSDDFNVDLSKVWNGELTARAKVSFAG